MPEWEKASRSTHLIDREKYNEIVTLLWSKWQKKEPSCYHKYRSIFFSIEKG
jgi:hypothetical protein